MRYAALCALLPHAMMASAGPVDQAAALNAMKNPGYLLIDVRTEQEFAAGHIDGAERIGHEAIGSEISRLTVDKNKTIILYCRSGNRSSQAQDVLQKAGYQQVINAGGYEALQKALKH